MPPNPLSIQSLRPASDEVGDSIAEVAWVRTALFGKDGCDVRIATTVLGVLCVSVVAASADPMNKNTKTFTADCSGLGTVTAVKVGQGNSFQVVGSTMVLIQDAPGVTKLAEAAGTTCDLSSVDGLLASGQVYFVMHNGAAGNTGGSSGGGKTTWDPALDWQDSPGQMNPSPDSAGNPDVWQYGSTSLAANGFLRFVDYDAVMEGWYDSSWGNLFVAHGGAGSAAIFMHSAGGNSISSGRAATLVWTSPVNAKKSLQIAGSVALGQNCGEGIVWSVYRDNVQLLNTAIPAGQSTSFNLSADNVQQGQTFFFVHHPGDNSDCDMATVQLEIR